MIAEKLREQKHGNDFEGNLKMLCRYKGLLKRIVSSVSEVHSFHVLSTSIAGVGNLCSAIGI